MHKAENILAAFHFGSDLEHFYLRFDFKKPLNESLKIKIHFTAPQESELWIEWKNSGIHGTFKNSRGEETQLEKIQYKKIIESAIPFSLLNAKKNDPIEFRVIVLEGVMPMESWPENAAITTFCPSDDFGADFWTV